MCRPARRARHAAIGDADIDDMAVKQSHAQSREHRGNIFFIAFGHFKRAEMRALRQQRNMQRAHIFARTPILLAIGQKEILQGDGAGFARATQFEHRTERDQRGSQIADRRTIGNVAADRARAADLGRAEPLH